ncbi:hypothetical protein [Sphaerotilus sp.]|uniref:hypothetical protein n=1 Tax=Sphaerotilus sp. TaxID=2093942 RepID=UPI0025D7F2CF|nr:hypothetical protein [Sphaerotilus sp.]
MVTIEQPRKTTSHGRIGEAAVTAKCWMNGVPAHNTNGLRANFAGSDIIIDTSDPSKKLLVQVKTGYSPAKKQVYLTQATGEQDLENPKFKADFVVFVNIDKKAGESHQHRGTLGFEHFTYFIVPVVDANKMFRDAVRREYDRPLIKTGERRKLTNLAVYVEPELISKYQNAWHLLRGEPL